MRGVHKKNRFYSNTNENFSTCFVFIILPHFCSIFYIYDLHHYPKYEVGTVPREGSSASLGLRHTFGKHSMLYGRHKESGVHTVAYRHGLGSSLGRAPSKHASSQPPPPSALLSYTISPACSIHNLVTHKFSQTIDSFLTSSTRVSQTS